MGKLPILTFEPLFKETVWGGRKLETLLNKSLPGEGPVGESWELVDLPTDQSIVAGGGLDGKTLGSLREGYTDELLGGVDLLEGRFPLLFKFIDAQQTLSVQVHPDEGACARLGGGARPKTEAWFILDCEPGAVLYVGLREGVDKKTFDEAIGSGTVEQLLHKLVVKPGDFVFLPSGTIHAIGKGIVLAEVQQSSNTTYRVFDWNRMGLDGKPRQLHVAEALESISFGEHGVPASEKPPSGRVGIACADFIMERVVLEDGEGTDLAGSGPLVLMGIGGEGEVEVRAGEDTSTMRCGETRFVTPASGRDVRLESRGRSEILSTRIPE